MKLLFINDIRQFLRETALSRSLCEMKMKIVIHKFTSEERYLCYLNAACDSEHRILWSRWWEDITSKWPKQVNQMSQKWLGQHWKKHTKKHLNIKSYINSSFVSYLILWKEYQVRRKMQNIAKAVQEEICWNSSFLQTQTPLIISMYLNDSQNSIDFSR